MPRPENQATPSCTMSKRSVYAPLPLGKASDACRFADAPGARSAASFVRMPSQTAARPAPSIQWYARLTGFAPADGQAKFEVFITVIGTDVDEPEIARVCTAGAYVAPYDFTNGPATAVARLPVGKPLPENHETPSCTRSNRRLDCPPDGGAITCACTVTD